MRALSVVCTDKGKREKKEKWGKIVSQDLLFNLYILSQDIMYPRRVKREIGGGGGGVLISKYIERERIF